MKLSNKDIPTHSHQQVDDPFKKVAKLYEKQFMREMVKAMRGSVGRSELIKTNMGQKIYEEKLDHEYVEKWGDTGGIGLSDIIYEQLVEKYGTRKEFPLPRDQFIPLKKGDIESFQLEEPGSKGIKIHFKTKKPGASLTVPDEGRVERVFEPLPGYQRVEFQIGKMKGVAQFQGESLMKEGQVFSKGTKMGVLSPESQHLSVLFFSS